MNIEQLKDVFEMGYETYKDSRDKAILIEEMFHNRQYTDEQINQLKEIGQPIETFNIIKLFTRQLVGYYSTVFNTVRVAPIKMSEMVAANVFNDVMKYIDYENSFKQLSDAIKIDGFLSGLFVQYTHVVDTGAKDKWGRPIYEVKKEHVPSHEVILDPMSRELDYSDARYIHRFKWMAKEKVKQLFPHSNFTLMEDKNNHVDVEGAEYYDIYNNTFSGLYNYYEHYLIVHSIYVETETNKIYSVYWCGDTILEKKDITDSPVKNPYTVVKLIKTRKAEYYGVFNDVYESQYAINQALLQIQFLVNTNRTFVNENAVDDFEEFKKSYNRVNAIVQVMDINGIRIDKLNAEIQNQYIVIDRAFDRIQKVLGINDSFLGMAFASDSGKKVKLQQNATVVGLQYIDNALEQFYRIQGTTTVNYIKAYYRANQVMVLLDSYNETKYIEINKPIVNPQTQQPFYEEALDPETGEPLEDEEGNIIVVPVNDPDTDLELLDIKLFVESVNISNEEERAQMLIETVLNGNAGQMLMTVNPAGYAQIAALNIKTTKTRYSQEIAAIFEQTAQMLSPQPQQQQTLGSADGSSSQVGGLPNKQTYSNKVTGEA